MQTRVCQTMWSCSSWYQISCLFQIYRELTGVVKHTHAIMHTHTHTHSLYPTYSHKLTHTHTGIALYSHTLNVTHANFYTKHCKCLFLITLLFNASVERNADETEVDKPIAEANLNGKPRYLLSQRHQNVNGSDMYTVS